MRASVLDDKTERILKLKEFERSNKNRMNVFSGIMGYGQYKDEYTDGNAAKYSYSVNDDGIADEVLQGNQAKELKGSFKIRLFFCIIIFGFILSDRYWLHKLPQSIYQNAEKEIAADYSAGIIDFIQEFPYTLEYEKTGAE